MKERKRKKEADRKMNGRDKGNHKESEGGRVSLKLCQISLR